MLGDQLSQPGEAEHLALRVVGLYQPVAVEECTLTHSQDDLLFLVVHTRHKAQRHASRPQFLCGATVAHIGKVVTCVGVGEVTALWLEDGVEAGYEHVGWYTR